jgi:hypothetical protein
MEIRWWYISNCFRTGRAAASPRFGLNDLIFLVSAELYVSEIGGKKSLTVESGFDKINKRSGNGQAGIG